MAELQVGERQEADRDNMFRDSVDGKVYRRISGTIVVGSSGTLLAGVSFDTILASYPSALVEVYDYQLATVSQAIVTVTYQDVAKNIFLSAART